ncbi:hypothetical protein BT63DRAFT_462166 [Microthyrium microscopicum]|uniref:Uncharacterized protein n=1 Tax=Microthyrium microscopicum TaxID=703497 RepID=A0A6A6UT48_9PEZI|nr:hypothetical protein BT63DRAFT_462166 [Microthyrium microscopicum]
MKFISLSAFRARFRTAAPRSNSTPNAPPTIIHQSPAPTSPSSPSLERPSSPTLSEQPIPLTIQLVHPIYAARHTIASAIIDPTSTQDSVADHVIRRIYASKTYVGPDSSDSSFFDHPNYWDDEVPEHRRESERRDRREQRQVDREEGSGHGKGKEKGRGGRTRKVRECNFTWRVIEEGTMGAIRRSVSWRRGDWYRTTFVIRDPRPRGLRTRGQQGQQQRVVVPKLVQQTQSNAWWRPSTWTGTRAAGQPRRRSSGEIDDEAEVVFSRASGMKAGYIARTGGRRTSTQSDSAAFLSPRY